MHSLFKSPGKAFDGKMHEIWRKMQRLVINKRPDSIPVPICATFAALTFADLSLEDFEF